MAEESMQSGVSRRSMLRTAGMAGALHAIGSDFARAELPYPVAPSPEDKLNISLFSKHLEWLSVPEAAAAAQGRRWALMRSI